MTKSAMATPGRVDLAVSTVKIDGSYRKIIQRTICVRECLCIRVGSISHEKLMKHVLHILNSTVNMSASLNMTLTA